MVEYSSDTRDIAVQFCYSQLCGEKSIYKKIYTNSLIGKTLVSKTNFLGSIPSWCVFGNVVKLVKAIGCNPIGNGSSPFVTLFFARIAKWIRHQISNLACIGSNPITSIFLYRLSI